jgi:beta-glucanase (GH16 family)
MNETQKSHIGSSSPNYLQSGLPLSGGVTGAFLYAPDAITEIDIEIEGNRPELIHSVTWTGYNQPNEHQVAALPGALPTEKFYTYTIDWRPGSVKFYRDGVLYATHTAVVPSTPAQMIFNHWGSNSENWGGPASPGVSRYLLVDKFTYRPL